MLWTEKVYRSESVSCKMSSHLQCRRRRQDPHLTKLWTGVYLAVLSLLFCPCSAGSYLANVQQCKNVITSDSGQNGTITSPHYPHPYPPRTHCRYDFVGNENERVQIIFTDFNLYHPDRNPESCGGADMLSAFVYGKSSDELDKVEDFCGTNTTQLLGVMSNGNKMTLEFNAPHSSKINRGFSALYSFVTDFGIRTGRQTFKDNENPCTFVFNSSETSNGTFTSPNYPGYYPRDTTCDYFFYGRDDEHVELYFPYFDINGIQPCDELAHSDYVEFSNYRNVDRKYDIQCGTLKELKVNSDRKFFRVTFRSNSQYDATGFQATYQFTDQNNQQLIRNVRSNAPTMFPLNIVCITHTLTGISFVFALFSI